MNDLEKAKSLILNKKTSLIDLSKDNEIPYSTLRNLRSKPEDLTKASWQRIHKLASIYDKSLLDHFNLVNDPWIKVLNIKDKTEIVSLKTLFQNAQNYRRLAGEMPTQDIIILRFLLAILTTVYSRINANGESYSWLKVDNRYRISEVSKSDSIADDLMNTWKTVFENKHFSNSVVKYLEANKDSFKFNDTFYQVPASVYDKLVPDNKHIDIEKKRGVVGIRQINRTISESGNDVDVFSPKSNSEKDNLDIDELVRWIIMYENISGTTEKTKIKSKESFSISPGWYYKLDAIHFESNNLFETLMYNLVLKPYSDGYRIETPIWEFSSMEDYVNLLKTNPNPQEFTISMLYTSAARMFHIEWVDGKPTVFSAGLPSFNNNNTFNEPMAVWTYNEKEDTYYSSAISIERLDTNAWQKINKYIDVTHEPEIILWLRDLVKKEVVPSASSIRLQITNLVSDGKSYSQLPIAEYDRGFSLPINILLDRKWNKKLTAAVKQISFEIGNYRQFINNINELRQLKDKNTIAKLADRQIDQLNYTLNDLFRRWNFEINSDSDSEQAIRLFEMLDEGIKSAANDLVQRATPKDIKGTFDDDGNVVNIFTLYNWFKLNSARITKNLNSELNN